MEQTVHEINKNAEAFQLKRLYVFSKTQGRFNQNVLAFSGPYLKALQKPF